jgi:hypothetical protein
LYFVVQVHALVRLLCANTYGTLRYYYYYHVLRVLVTHTSLSLSLYQVPVVPGRECMVRVEVILVLVVIAYKTVVILLLVAVVPGTSSNDSHSLKKFKAK